MSKLCALLLVSMGLLLTPTVEAKPNPHLRKGIKLLNDMEDSQALKEFQRALTIKGSEPEEKAQIHIYIGMTYVNLLNTEAAKKSFRQALTLNPSVALPKMTSPKIKSLFGKVRDEMGIKVDTPPPDKPPPDRPPIPPEPPPATQQVVPPPRPPPPPSGRPVAFWLAIASLGTAVAIGSTGLALGLLSRSGNDDASNLKLDYAAAKDLHDTAESQALGANICFGIAGAAAVASAILFYYGLRKTEQPRAAASVVPLPTGGALLQVTGVTW
jgi:tetratricopeptide (TPR) repeat protein